MPTRVHALHPAPLYLRLEADVRLALALRQAQRCDSEDALQQVLAQQARLVKCKHRVAQRLRASREHTRSVSSRYGGTLLAIDQRHNQTCSSKQATRFNLPGCPLAAHLPAH